MVGLTDRAENFKFINAVKDVLYFPEDVKVLWASGKNIVEKNANLALNYFLNIRAAVLFRFENKAMVNKPQNLFPSLGFDWCYVLEMCPSRSVIAAYNDAKLTPDAQLRTLLAMAHTDVKLDYMLPNRETDFMSLIDPMHSLATETESAACSP